ncbi:MAG: BON domain-containing protein [Anaerolineales bacterium]|nr:BON domain-containing protein [Anaerolineales bacterium]
MVTQMPESSVDEINRCRDRSWLSLEDQQPNGIANLVEPGEWVATTPKMPDGQRKGLISIGQKVFLPGEQLIGLTTKLYHNSYGQVSHLAIRTARLFGHHKMVPIAFVSDVTPLRVLLSMDREQFMDLAEYQSDSAIAEEVDRALWKDVVLRDSDYHVIDVQVRDGIITLTGLVITSMNQWRAETAVKSITNILGVKSYLIPDDKLIMQIADALACVEQNPDSKFFTKVENGVVTLVGEVSSISLRDQVEQIVAEIPWVRGVINEIRAPGIVLDPEEQRFLQPMIGKEMFFQGCSFGHHP